MKKIFIIKSKNVETNEVKELSSWAFKDYKTAVDYLKSKLIVQRAELMEKKYNQNTDMTSIIKGFIEVHETKKGQSWEANEDNLVKVYNYNF